MFLEVRGLNGKAEFRTVLKKAFASSDCQEMLCVRSGKCASPISRGDVIFNCRAADPPAQRVFAVRILEIHSVSVGRGCRPNYVLEQPTDLWT